MSVPSKPIEYVDLIFRTRGPDAVFVEAELPDGRSLSFGTIVPDPMDGYYRLRIKPSDFDAGGDKTAMEKG